ncbi:ECF transporter S component [Clostridium saccharoperbutylacetonicum]|uniref:ECF transporter S component n=1 Tax=Clostridium saccharoperbutylacetonicum TaxID=36745 RepID=UPI000983A630|nr:ECF transporter S component [Clostridium saccharoperbutylacetonicum]AQR97515.1 pantothenic acid transporter PanT [Clostridium saccharoperbutylacetonicum]NSB33399.1 putative membrane protein [Clostridium saccharoperbutylacetonicum]
MERINVKPKLSVRQITMIGMLSAISIFLGVTGLGFIPIPPVKATIMHIPVIIGAIVEGPIVGAFVGLVFGLFSMYQELTTMLPTGFMFLNPIIAIVPRILIGISAYYIYVFFKNKFNKPGISIGIASLCATLVNTIGVLGLTYIIYAERFANVIGVDPSTIGYVILFTIGIPNGIPEAIVSMLLCIPIILTVLKIKK